MIVEIQSRSGIASTYQVNLTGEEVPVDLRQYYDSKQDTRPPIVVDELIWNRIALLFEEIQKPNNELLGKALEKIEAAQPED